MSTARSRNGSTRRRRTRAASRASCGTRARPTCTRSTAASRSRSTAEPLRYAPPMRSLAWSVIVIVAACGSRTTPSAPAVVEVDDATLVIRAARMVDVAAGAYVDDVAIAIAGDRIRYAGPKDGVRVGAGAREVVL